MTKLSIIIPAYNEEAIADTIGKCLNARNRIIADTPVREVDFFPDGIRGSVNAEDNRRNRIPRDARRGTWNA